jgi:hypothetical protein
VFFHEQDDDSLNVRGSCYLAFAHDTGNHIQQRLEEAGLEVEWDGKNSSRILVRKRKMVN